MKEYLAVTPNKLKVRLFTFTLPVLMVGMLQVGGCMRTATPPPPPGGTYLSTDGGVTFEQSVMIAQPETAGENIARYIMGQAHRPIHSPKDIYLPARDRGFVVSKDNGKTWSVVPSPLASVINVVILPNDTWVVSGTGHDGQGYVIRSLNQGDDWEIVLTVPLPPQERRFFLQGGSTDASVVISISQDPFNPDRIYAGSNLGTIFLGERSAQAWRNFHSLGDESLRSLQSQQTSSVQKVIPSVNDPNDYLVLTSNRSLYRVTEGVQQRVDIPRNLTGETSFFGGGESLSVFDAKFIPGFPDALLAGVHNGVVLSVDRGNTWRRLHVPIDEVLDFSRITVTTSPANPNRFFVTFNNVMYRSEDAGQTWITYSFGALGIPGIINDVSIDPLDENNILVVTSPANI